MTLLLDFAEAVLGKQTFLELTETIANANYELGIGVGLSQAASLLKKESGEFFVAGRDTDAHVLRTVSMTLEAESVR